MILNVEFLMLNCKVRGAAARLAILVQGYKGVASVTPFLLIAGLLSVGMPHSDSYLATIAILHQNKKRLC